MASRRTPWLRWTLVLSWLLFAATADAAVQVARPPAGWAPEASPKASARASTWAELTGGRVTEVFSTYAEDSFTETIAILNLPGAMASDAALDPEAALVAAVGGMFESAPQSPRYLDTSGEAPIVTGMWDEDDVTYQVAVASGGPNRGAIIFAYRSAERSLYAPDFEEVLAEITGTAPPMVAFDLPRWRIGSAIAWIVASMLVWIVVANTGRGRDGAAAVGRGVAMLVIVLALVAAVVVFVGLRGETTSLQLAGSSAFGVATEVAGGGILVALLVWFLGAVRDSLVRRVQSAPRGGSFSSSATMRTLTHNLVPPTRPAVLTDPGHGMTAEDLERADREAMKAREARQPQATLVGTPSLATAAASGDPAFDEIWARAQAAEEADVEVLDVGNMPTAELERPNFTVPAEVLEAKRPPPKASAGTIVGPAPGPAPKRKPKTKTEILQFPAPMSEKRRKRED